MQKIGLFVGSFDPFTIGHDDIVKRAIGLFDRLVIGVGINPDKATMLTAEERVAAITALYAHDSRIDVVAYSDLTIDLARRMGARWLVRGVRSVQDFEYERELGDVNHRLGQLETVLIVAKPELSAISSSTAKTLHLFGKDISWMLPTPDAPHHKQ